MSNFMRHVRLKTPQNTAYLLKNIRSGDQNRLTHCCVRRYSSHIKRSRLLNTEQRHIVHKLHTNRYLPVICSIPLIRHNSSSANIAADTVSEVADYIPPPPSVPLPETAEHILNALGEPTFACLGLGGYTPPGLIQNALEFLHVSGGMSWLGCIITCSIGIRMLLIPLMLNMQKNIPKRMESMPKINKIQEELTLAKIEGNTFEISRLQYELYTQMKGTFSPLTLLTPLIQGAVVVSNFMALKGMANLPVETMKTGGALWFTDLTVADPTYILPAMSVVAAFVTLELGVDGVSAQSMQKMKWVIRVLPFVGIPFLINFPGALLCYWVTSSFIGIFQVALMKNPNVRKTLGLPDNKPKVAMVGNLKKPQGMLESINRGRQNKKILHIVENRYKIDAEKFKKAGQGPITKTYSYDPTKLKD